MVYGLCGRREGSRLILYYVFGSALDLLWISVYQLVLLSNVLSWFYHKFCLASWISRTLQTNVSETTVPVHCLPHIHIRHMVEVRAYQFVIRICNTSKRVVSAIETSGCKSYLHYDMNTSGLSGDLCKRSFPIHPIPPPPDSRFGVKGKTSVDMTVY